jgi:4-amino-4-deoxy-L-arabinose transferase-like glycosyltransferase
LSSRTPITLQSLILTALCIIVFVPGLSSLPATDRDEAQFAQTTRQMIESGDFIRPRFQNRDSFHKPVGVYWAQSAAVAALGTSDHTKIWPYRVPSVIGAIIAILMTLRIGRILFDDSVAMLAAALLAVSPLMVVEAHLATTDALLLACVTSAMASLAAIYKSVNADEKRLGEVIVFWIAIGLAVLVKGPVLPALLSLTVAVLSITERDNHTRLLKALRPAWGAVIALAIVSPWLIGIARVSGGSFFEIFWREVSVKVSRVNLQHGGPPGYYLALAVISFWPGSLLALITLITALRFANTAATRFCLAWLVPAWIVLELIPSKLPHYVLPLYPALALLVANVATLPSSEWRTRMSTTIGRISSVVWAIGALLIGGAWALIPILLGGPIAALDFVPAILMIALVIVAVQFLRAGKMQWTIDASIAAAAIIYPLVFSILLPRMPGLWLTPHARQAIVEAAPHGREPLIAVGYHEPSLAFALKRPVMMLDPHAANEFLKAHRDAMVLTDERDEAALSQAAASDGIALHKIWTFTGYNYNKGAVTHLALLEAGRASVSREPAVK